MRFRGHLMRFRKTAVCLMERGTTCRQITASPLASFRRKFTRSRR